MTEVSIGFTAWVGDEDRVEGASILTQGFVVRCLCGRGGGGEEKREERKKLCGCEREREREREC